MIKPPPKIGRKKTTRKVRYGYDLREAAAQLRAQKLRSPDITEGMAQAPLPPQKQGK